jgi:hypothetical protein
MNTRSRTRLSAGALSLALLGGVPIAQAQIPSATQINPALNCAPNDEFPQGRCVVTTYGLGAPADYAQGEPIVTNPVFKSHEHFAGSYFYRRNNPNPAADLGECIAEAAFAPIYGQVLLREQADCVPPALPATGQCRDCIAGAGNCSNGAACSSIFDCPGGVCDNVDAGCPVEIATDLATPGLDIVYFSKFQTVTSPGLYVLTAFNGALTTDGPTLFSPPKRAGLGRRFIRPAGGTQIIWIDLLNGGGNTVGENQSVLCCDDNVLGALCANQPTPFQVYPTLTSLPQFANEGRGEAPFIFPNDDPGTPLVEGDFDTDQSYVIPGQVYGNCTLPLPAAFVSPDGVPRTVRNGCSAPGGLANASCTAAGSPLACCTGPRTGTCTNADTLAQCVGSRNPYPCCTGAGTGNCGDECVIRGAGGVVLFDSGPCNLAEVGLRFNRLHSSKADGAADPGKCNANPFRFRGTKNANCSVLKFYNECLNLPHNEACVSNQDPFPCCTGAGTGTCGAAQTCVLRGRCANDQAIVCDDNAANGNECAGVGGACDLGVTGRCSVSTDVRCSPGPSPYPETDHGNPRWGDPLPRCQISNFGPQARADLNCDGVEDPTVDTNADGIADQIGDLCAFYTETNSVDVNPSPAVNTFNADNTGRANECECGDSNRDGRVNVSDLIDINSKIFNPPTNPFATEANLLAPLSDANEDNRINVSDLVATNLTIFVPLSSRCGRSPVIGQ